MLPESFLMIDDDFGLEVSCSPIEDMSDEGSNGTRAALGLEDVVGARVRGESDLGRRG